MILFTVTNCKGVGWDNGEYLIDFYKYACDNVIFFLNYRVIQKLGFHILHQTGEIVMKIICQKLVEGSHKDSTMKLLFLDTRHKVKA